MKDYIIEFEKQIRTDGATENTINSYIRDIIKFSNYYSNTEIISIDKKCVYDYLSFLNDSGASKSTIDRSISSLRKFFAFLLAKGIIKVNPVNDFKLLKNENRNPDILTKDEIVNFLSMPKGDSNKAKRDRVILDLLYSTGVKVSELIEIKLENVNLSLGLLNITTNGKTRIIPLYEKTLKILSDYMQNIRPLIANQNSKELFVNRNGKSLSRQGVWKIINYYAEKCEINKSITANTLRHSFITHLLENGAQVKYVKEILGFEDNSSLRFYNRRINSERRDAYKKYHTNI